MYKSVLAAVHIVEKMLVGQLPTMIDIEEANEGLSPQLVREICSKQERI